ncbi:hypothetical protein [Metamycoplasma hominis]|uniref:hypothetical protein n=1 Tax=Metamycoplasma hominis TaxID=2098 RepID=UPI0006552342|nr:hypothetical protein [Metamycoplasma hominis]AKJ52328.1 Lmp1 protein [Metamycoplasma hominis]
MNEKKKKIAIPLAILCGGLAIATTALIAIKARRHKIANQLQKENLLQNFKKLQKQLKELLGYKIVNEINVFNEQEVLQGSLKINNKSETKVIEEETLRLKDAITLLISKIKNQINQKELEFAKFNEIKDKLQEYIKNELSKQEYEHIKQNIENELNKYTPISLESTLIEIQNATNNLIKLLNESTKEKDNIDNLNAKEQLKASISQANQLLPQLSDNDSEIAKAKKSLDTEIKNANQAVTSNNTASMQSAKTTLDAKVAQVNQQLQQFNKEKENKFNELKQTRNQIDEFIKANKSNSNYSALISKLTAAKEAKNSVVESSNKSDIIAANEALKQALQEANASKSQADNSNKLIKEQLNASITSANQLSAKLTDNDNNIQQAKAQLAQEIQKANQAVASNNTASMQSAKTTLDAKIAQVNQQLQQFNKEKENKFNELKQTRNQIDEFIKANKGNSNYSALISKLTAAKEAKNSVVESSNKSDIIAANEALKQALQEANASKSQADNSNKLIKEQLNASITSANQLSAKLTDNDNNIQQAKAQLAQEIQKANQAVASNNTASMQSAKTTLDAKIAQVNQQLQQFNKEKENKFNELKQTRNQIDEFIKANKGNSNYSALISKLTAAKEAKNSVVESSNKSDIIAANEALKQALQEANASKSQADNSNKLIKEQLNASITSANQLSAKLTDNDNNIQQAKAQLAQEIQKANQAVASNNTASMQLAKTTLDAKIAQVNQQLQQFNKEKENKFNELKQTRNQIDEFIKANKGNSNYSALISKLTAAKEAKNSVVESSNKSDIIAANEALKQALQEANASKSQADNSNKLIKEQLNASITSANQLSAKLTDNDNNIQQAKAQLAQEIQKANQAVASNNTASMQSAKTTLDAKIAQVNQQLQQFNKEKENKFNELKQTRNQIDEFIKANKGNSNYSALISKLTAAKEAKNSVVESSNKSDIIAANEALKQALQEANASKSQADNSNKLIKEQLNASITSANQLSAKLTDNDNNIQQAKAQLAQEIQKANQAVASNNTASMQSAKTTLDAKIAQVNQQLQQFNKEKENKFNELKQTRNQIDEFIKANKGNSNYSALISKLTAAKEAKNSVVESSNKSDIIAANEALKQALQEANASKSQADNSNKLIKEQLNASITSANQLSAKLTDNDNNIQQAKAQLAQEIQKANQAVASNNTASMQSAKTTLDAKIAQVNQQLQQFNKEKENKFNELKQTRNQIDEFIKANKGNSNYSALISKLTAAKEAKNSVVESSNKSDIIAANEALKQALQEANASKSQADNSNKLIKEQLNASITSANQLSAKLTDNDNNIQQAKAQLAQEIQKANQAVASNNTASMQSAKTTLDAKIAQVNQQLQQFNKEKENKFNELKQTRNQIDEFIKANKGNSNYSALISKLTAAKEAKNSVVESSNKSDIIAANEALKQALQEANASKSQADNSNKLIKEQLNASITSANQLSAKLTDNDNNIQQAKAQLAQEIQKANQAVASNNTASMQSAKTTLDAKIAQVNQQLQQFNKEKENKFNELKQTRNQIDEFIKANKGNSNYSALISKLTAAKEAKNSVVESSNKSDIIAANEALKQALQEANASKSQADNSNKLIKEQLNASITSANQLSAKLTDNDNNIQQAKAQLAQEIQKANQAVASNNTASMQSAKTTLDAKIAQVNQQLQQFNKEKENKFNELKQTRNQIDEFIKANKGNSNYSALISKLTAAKEAKNSVVESSNKSDIIAANEALKQALQEANASKSQADNSNKLIKEQLNASITSANQLSAKLTDNDNNIQQAKAQLAQEIQKANQAVASNNTASMQSAKTTLDAKIAQVNQQLQQFNKEKENKFNELKQTRNQIDEFIKANKGNSNYSALISKLTAAKEAKNSVVESSNKSDIIAANEALKQALQEANASKSQADNSNKLIKEQLNASITSANQLSAKLTDNDNNIQQAKAQLAQEIQKANQAVASNNTASMQLAKTTLDAKIAQVNQQLQQFNKEKENKFNELKQTRNQIDEFIKANKGNSNYSALISKLTAAKEAKNSVVESSNKSDIIAANEALKQALQEANASKSQADNSNKLIKEQLNASITSANQLSAKLTDNDNNIQQAKAQLAQEIQKANQAVASNNTASMQSAKTTLDAKIAQVNQQLQQFNKEKENKFNELKQTRNQIDEFIKANKGNSNYSALISKLTAAKEAKNSVVESSNKSDIIAANEALKQALQEANASKSQADNSNKLIKEQLNASITSANQLSAKLTDNDNNIQQAKAQLAQEIQKANQAVASNNTASMQSAKTTLDAKIAQVNQQLQQFNKEKENKFNELKQTRNQIDEFIKANKGNSNYSALISKLTAAKEAKNSVVESSNKSDIIAANQALQQALNTAKAKKSSIDNELKPLKDDLQSKIEEFGPIRNTNFSWISSKLETAKNKLAEELTKADAIKNNPSSSKQALKDSSQQVQKLGNELLKTITEELGKVETKNSNIGYRLFKLAQAEQFNNSDVDKLKNAWEERQTLISKKQKPGNQSIKDYLTQLSTEMSAQESTIKKVIVDIQAHIRNNLNIQHRSEAQKLIDNMKRYYGDKVGIESLQNWQDLMDHSVLNVDDSLKDDFNKALRVLVGDYTKNPPVSSWFINKRNRSIENYQNLRNLILVRENEILLDKAKDLDKRAEKTIKFVDENINNLGQRAKTLKQEILNAKKDLSNFTLNHQKNQFTAKEINPKISLLENKLNEINQYLLPIIKQKAVSKISEIEKNKKELEDIIRSNFYLWEKNEINKYISELTNKQVDLRSNINFERNWESIKDKLDNLNIKENVSLLKEVIINNSNAQYSINRILLTISEFIKVAKTTRSNNLRSLAEIQFKPTLLDIDKNLKEVKKILDENKTLSRENITKLNEKIKLFVDRSRELKESLRWFDRQNENISDQRIKNKLDEVRELLKNV